MQDTALETWMPAPKDFAEAAKMAEWLARSSLVPDGYRGKPADVLIVADFGRRLGLPLLTALQGIAIINGKPTLWGDCQLAICRAHPAFRGLEIRLNGEGSHMIATATVRREGEAPTIRSFSMKEAEKAGLANKLPWKSYPGRMLSARARSWALRDAFADALVGIGSAEELVDVDPRRSVPLDRVVDADELLLPAGGPAGADRPCIECGEPVTSRAPRAQRCDAHLSPPKKKKAAAPAPAPEPAPDLDVPVVTGERPTDFESRMRAATTEEDLMAVGREAAASDVGEPLLVRLRRVYHDRQAELHLAKREPKVEPWGEATEGLEALRARQAGRQG